MEKEVKAVPEGFRDGFPKFTCGMEGTYVFAVALNDETTVEAIVRSYDEPHPSKWIDVKTRGEITHKVVGWRETYTCENAHEAIAWYIRNPYSIRSRDGFWADALYRHIVSVSNGFEPTVTCVPCAQYFVKQWKAKYEEVPEGWEAYA